MKSGYLLALTSSLSVYKRVVVRCFSDYLSTESLLLLSLVIKLYQLCDICDKIVVF